jgi:hypothetical protein
MNKKTYVNPHNPTDTVTVDTLQHAKALKAQGWHEIDAKVTTVKGERTEARK